MRILRFGLAGLLVWQAVAAAFEHGRRIAASADAGVEWRACLCASTAERVQRVLGEDAALVAELPRLVPMGTLVLNQQVTGTIDDLRRTAASEQELVAAFQQLAARNGLFLQLTALLFPRPFLLSVPSPIPLAEQEAAAGRERWLFVLSGDPEPRDRAGWTCVHRVPRFSLWRFQKGS